MPCVASGIQLGGRPDRPVTSGAVNDLAVVPGMGRRGPAGSKSIHANGLPISRDDRCRTVGRYTTSTCHTTLTCDWPLAERLIANNGNDLLQCLAAAAHTRQIKAVPRTVEHGACKHPRIVRRSIRAHHRSADSGWYVGVPAACRVTTPARTSRSLPGGYTRRAGQFGVPASLTYAGRAECRPQRHVESEFNSFQMFGPGQSA